MKTQFDRRRFMQQAAALGAGAYTLDSKLLVAEQSPNEQLNIACIGVGGKGDSDTDSASHFGNVVALCDIDDNMLSKKAATFPQARKFHDFRQMLDEMQDQIDVVTVSTPDHTHAAASMMAMKLKKHVYTQKPLTWSVSEARDLREAAKQFGVCTQMGNQGQASDGSRHSIEIIRSGVLGDVQTVHAWTDRCGKYWKQAPDLVARPNDRPLVPAHVHWDLFLGPAPERPYHPDYHPFMWRGWRDFGTGALGDMACHIMNVPYMGLNLTSPVWVSAENSEINLETYQQWATITYQFAAGEEHGPIQLHWWEGNRNGKRNLPPAELRQGAPVEANGMLVIGSEGTLYCTGEGGDTSVLLPRKKFADYELPEPTFPRLGKGSSDVNQKKEWFAAIRAGQPELALSNFEYAGKLTEMVLLGNIAVSVGKKLEWDGPNLKFPNAPEAETFLRRDTKQGWTL